MTPRQKRIASAMNRSEFWHWVGMVSAALGILVEIPYGLDLTPAWVGLAGLALILGSIIPFQFSTDELNRAGSMLYRGE